MSRKQNSIRLVLVACSALMVPVCSLAQEAEPTPRLPDGRPDLSGVWNGGGGIRGLKPGEEMIMTPWAQAIFDYRTDPDGNAANADPNLHCLPSGVPRMSPYPWRIVQTPTHRLETHIFILFEGNIHSYRQIFMDGRPHAEDPNPSWYGDSIGWWEGDTLGLHLIERFTRIDKNTLEWEITIDDPIAYEKPFTVLTHAELIEGELMEYICTENNTSIGAMRGPARNPGN